MNTKLEGMVRWLHHTFVFNWPWQLGFWGLVVLTWVAIHFWGTAAGLLLVAANVWGYLQYKYLVWKPQVVTPGVRLSDWQMSENES